MHQNRASPFASDFYSRRGYRREFRSEDRFSPFSSQKKSRFASDFLHRENRASWGLKKSRDFPGGGKNRRRSRRESRDFGALRFDLAETCSIPTLIIPHKEGPCCVARLTCSTKICDPGRHLQECFRARA